MKRFIFPLMLGMFCTVCLAQGRNDAVADAVRRQAEEETINKLRGDLDDLRDSKAVQDKRMNERLLELSREITSLREQLNKPHPVYATAEDIRLLREALQVTEHNIEEVDRNRKADSDRLTKKLEETFEKLAAIASKPVMAPPQPHRDETPDPTPTKVDEIDFPYEIKPNDNFEKIAKAYRAKGIKVTAEQIAKANPTVKPGHLIIGNKLWVPAPPAGSATPATPDGGK